MGELCKADLLRLVTVTQPIRLLTPALRQILHPILRPDRLLCLVAPSALRAQLGVVCLHIPNELSLLRGAHDQLVHVLMPHLCSLLPVALRLLDARSGRCCRREPVPRGTDLISLELRRAHLLLSKLLFDNLRCNAASAVQVKGEHRLRNGRPVEGLSTPHYDGRVDLSGLTQLLEGCNLRPIRQKELGGVEHPPIEAHLLLYERKHLAKCV
mmetsp:Transcript_54350/g.140383  ORF Transcript_54350/g.140383 Transcript_54350/m.140383 type:complete len:212 (-) Transcript_54350:427-1062(-)